MKMQWAERGSVDHELIWGSVALVVLVASAFLPLDRMMDRAGYRCPFRTMTGLPCPTCRGTRTLVAMGSLRFREGFLLNPMVAAGWAVALVYVPYALLACLCGGRRLRITDVSARQRLVLGILLVCVGLGNSVYMIVSG